METTGELLDLPLREFVDKLAAEEPAPASGSASALLVAMAAALIAKVARGSPDWLAAGAAVAQAENLRKRATSLAQADADAYEEALAALRLPEGLEKQVRDMAIGGMLGRTLEVLLAIGDAGADVATLAAVAVEHGSLERRPDAVAAAMLADAGARASAYLVEVNLVVTPDDERVLRARASSEVASTSARTALLSTST